MADGAAQEKKTGGMVALLPADPGLLVIDHDNAEPAEDQHCTLLFLGSDVTGWSEARVAELHDVLAAVAEERDGPIQAVVVGNATFKPGTDEPVAVHLISGDGLTAIHDRVATAAAAVLGDDLQPQFDPWAAHITGAYGAQAADLSYTGPVVLDRLVLVLAGERTEYPLLDAQARLGESVREAFAHGWALSGGPMTDRVKAACTAAVGYAHDHPDDPDLWENTIQLGSLEGTWAQIFQRREDLIAQHLRIIVARWRDAIAKLGVAAAVAAFARQAGISTETDHRAQDAEQQKAAAQAQARDLLHGLVEPTSPEYTELVKAVASALMDGQAEGHAGAVAIVADQMQAGTAINFDLAFKDAHQALGDLGQYWGDAQDWIGRIVNGAASDLGNALARVAADGGTYEELLAAADDVLGAAGDVRALDTLVDMAMSQSFSRGALSLYGREGVGQVDFVTAGGDRVCPICLAAEAANPWSRGSAPAPALHPYCLIGETRVNSPSPVRGASVREYVGEVVTIRTAFGHELTGTPNHPVATRRGWVALAELREGDHVLRSLSSEWPGSAVDPDVEHVPATIQQVAESFPVVLGPVPTAAEDFHGDGAGSEVHVVRTDGPLVGDVEPSGTEHVGHHQLGRGDVPVGPALVRQGATDLLVDGLDTAADGGMGGIGEPGALLRARVRHARTHAARAVAGLHTFRHEATPQGAAVDPQLDGKRQLALPGRVSLGDAGHVDDAAGPGPLATLPHGDTGRDQTLADRLGADPDGFADRLGAVSGGVAADQIVHVERHGFRGHVYNLDTRDGYYIGNGILTHNCRCVLMPTDPLQGIRSFNLANYLVGGNA